MHLKELSRHTGLTVPYIRKCLDYMHPIFAPYITKGRYNRIQIAPEGVVLFSHIAKLKAQDLTVAEIKRRLEKSMECDENLEKPPENPQPDTSQTSSQFLEKLEPAVLSFLLKDVSAGKNHIPPGFVQLHYLEIQRLPQ